MEPATPGEEAPAVEIDEPEDELDLPDIEDAPAVEPIEVTAHSEVDEEPE